MTNYSDISLTWSSDLTSYSGWAQHARGILKPLLLGGAQIRLELQRPSRPEARLDKFWEEKFKILTKCSPGHVKIFHGSINNIGNNETGGPIVVSTHWETKDVPNGWLPTLRRKDISSIIVPDDTLRDSLINHVEKPVYSVPFAIDSNELKGIHPINLNGLETNTIVFGVIGQWNNRRNMSDVVVAFLRAFSDKDNVALVIKTFGNDPVNIEDRKKLIDLIRQIKKDCKKPNLPKIVMLQEICSYKTMTSLLSRINIYVSASRGESKDISMLRCAAMGKQCILSDNTAHKPIINYNNPAIYPVSGSEEPVMLSNGPYDILDSWFRSDSIMLSEQMHKAYIDLLLHGEDTRSNLKKLKSNIRSDYHPDTVASKFAKVLRKISLPMVELT